MLFLILYGISCSSRKLQTVARKKLEKTALSDMTHHRSDEAETYASTTASPPPVQISLDDSIDTEYKESHFLSGSGLITPGTDFSEEVRASSHFCRVCTFVTHQGCNSASTTLFACFI